MTKNKGFTLIELMIVVVILFILAAMAAPALMQGTAAPVATTETSVSAFELN